MDYHLPVLASECIEALAIKPDGVYVDATFGGGGHARLILRELGDKGRLLGFDQDRDAVANVPDDPRFLFVPGNFRYLKRFLRLHGIRAVDGILADLGVSSHQLDTGDRGFSFRFEAALDMRMNQEGETTAADILNTYTVLDLQDLFSRYGEVRNARTLAQVIASAREVTPFQTIGQLLQVMDPVIRGRRNRYLAQVFQALRIEVNDEMGALAEFLEQSQEMLREGGRLVVISYHSVEDRMVKSFLKSGNVEGKLKKDFYGRIYRPFKMINKKAIVPETSEIEGNPRARSAKLRIGERLPDEDISDAPEN